MQLREEIRLLAAGRKSTGSMHTNFRHAASQDYADVTTEDAVSARLVLPQSNGRRQMALRDEIDEIFRREVKSLPAYEKAQAAGGSGVAPPVEEMNHLLMGLVVAVQRSFHLLANRVEDIEGT